MKNSNTIMRNSLKRMALFIRVARAIPPSSDYISRKTSDLRFRGSRGAGGAGECRGSRSPRMQRVHHGADRAGRSRAPEIVPRPGLPQSGSEKRAGGHGSIADQVVGANGLPFRAHRSIAENQ